MKWTNGQNIYVSDNIIDPGGSSVPAMGLYAHNSQTSLLVYKPDLRRVVFGLKVANWLPFGK